MRQLPNKFRQDASQQTARMASRRAANRLARKMNEVGGIDSEMRHHMSQMKREQAMLKRELQGLRLEYQKISQQAEKNHGVIHRAEPNLGSNPNDDDDEDPGSKKKQHIKSAPANHDYGRNYFGYFSTPGSNKKHNKTIKELEMSIDTLYTNAFDPVSESKRKKKLKLQKEHNMSVQEKVNSWNQKNSARRRKFSVTLPPNVEHLMYLREQVLGKAISDGPHEKKEVEALQLPEVMPRSARRNSDASDALDKIESAKDEQIVALSTGGKTPSKTEKKNSKSGSELTFDADVYAPDGRVRMLHRLPDPKKAYEEARRAKYVRTKYKRDFERQLSVSQIFKN